MPAPTIARGRFELQTPLLGATSGTTNGTWTDTGLVCPFTVTVSGSFVGGAVKVLVSNAATKPADSDNSHPQLGSTLTATDYRAAEQPFRWVKVANTSAFTSGTVSSADFLGFTTVPAKT